VPPILFISPPTLSNGVFQIELAGAPSGNYILQASTNLTQWISISANLPANAPFYFTDTNASNFAYRYYRVLFQP
jgi:hypothetical protein